MALKSVLLLLAAVALVESALPSVIRIAAVFDDDQDAKHELAFRYKTLSMVDMGQSIGDDINMLFIICRSVCLFHVGQYQNFH